MIYLYTENFYWLPRSKNFIKKLLGRGTRGPEAVVASLERGLKVLKVDYQINRPLPINPVSIGVLSGVETLRWALEQKASGKISRLVAGPNIVVTPLDKDGLIRNKHLDLYLVPAQWSKDWWTSLAPELAEKIKLWPAGVEDRGSLKKSKGICLVYRKFVDDDFFNVIISKLKLRGIDYKTVTYGQFRYQDFLALLSQSRFMLYLSPLESQGLALHDAWMADVPTLVYNSGVVHYKKFIWEGSVITAPYLTPACGCFFKNEADFESGLDRFLSGEKNFNPRQYSLENFIDAVCAQKYLSYLK